MYAADGRPDELRCIEGDGGKAALVITVYIEAGRSIKHAPRSLATSTSVSGFGIIVRRVSPLRRPPRLPIGHPSLGLPEL